MYSPKLDGKAGEAARQQNTTMISLPPPKGTPISTSTASALAPAISMSTKPEWSAAPNAGHTPYPDGRRIPSILAKIPELAEYEDPTSSGRSFKRQPYFFSNGNAMSATELLQSPESHEPPLPRAPAPSPTAVNHYVPTAGCHCSPGAADSRVIVNAGPHFVFETRLGIDEESVESAGGKRPGLRLDELCKKLESWELFMTDLKSKLVDVENAHHEFREWTVGMIGTRGIVSPIEERPMKRSKNYMRRGHNFGNEIH